MESPAIAEVSGARRLPPRGARWHLALSVLVLSLSLTWLGWLLTSRSAERQAHAQFERRVEEVHSHILARLSVYDEALRSAAALVEQGGTPTIAQWNRFIGRLGLAEGHPGMLALAYAPIVRRGEVEGFVAEARRDGIDDFRLWPGVADVMAVNRVTWPLDALNRRALGYDMLQDPVRRTAMEAARDLGETAVTARVILKVDVGAGEQAAYIAYHPVYRAGAPLDGTLARREALVGFVLSPIRMPVLMDHLLGGTKAVMDVRIYDGNRADERTLLYATADTGGRGAEWLSRVIRFPNRSWLVRYRAAAGGSEPLWAALPMVVLVGGGAISLLLAALTRGLVNSRSEALAAASRMTAALRDSEAKFRAIFDNSTQFAALLSARGEVVAANPAALGLLGCGVEAVAGLPLWRTQWLTDPGEQARLEEAVGLALGGGLARLEAARGGPGGAALWMEISLKPVCADDGRVAWVVVEGRDLTERRLREETLNQAVEALTRSNQELERFAYVASHDLQEPCRTIALYAQLLGRRHGETLDEEGREILQYLVDGAHRMRDLVMDLLAYSRVSSKAAPFVAVDCAGTVRAVLADLRAVVEESDAEVTVGPLPVVRGDPAQLAQLFQNLIGNALKFRREGQRPKVTVEAERVGRDWRFRVADNGIGIAPEYHQKVFEIFQRLHTADRYPGTGIGLAVCRRVAERHGGRIWVDSAEGQGARFLFTLPAADGAA